MNDVFLLVLERDKKEKDKSKKSKTKPGSAESNWKDKKDKFGGSKSDSRNENGTDSSKLEGKCCLFFLYFKEKSMTLNCLILEWFEEFSVWFQ